MHYFVFCYVWRTQHLLHFITNIANMSYLDINDSSTDFCTELDFRSCTYIEPVDLVHLEQPKNSDLTILQLNVRGLLNKQDLLKHLLLPIQPDILLLCETWLTNQTQDLIDLPGYKCYHKHRKDRIGGGVSVLIRSKLRSRPRPDLDVETQHYEHIVTELKTDKKNILLVSGYRPPNTNQRQFLVEYKRLYKNLSKNKHHEIIIGMDHNIDLLKSLSHGLTNEFLEFNLSKNLLPTVTKPTRITHKTATLIDNIFISGKLQQSWDCKLLIDDISDHLPCLLTLTNQNKSLRGKQKIEYRTLDDHAKSKIKNALEEVNWETRLSTLDVNQSFDSFHDYLIETIDRFAPKRVKEINCKKMIRDPWITAGLMVSLNKQRLLYRSQLGCGNNVSTHKYREYRNLLKKIIRRSKQEYIKTKCAQYKQNGKKLWQLINRVIGKTPNKKHVIDSLRVNGCIYQDSQTITNELCSFFSTVGENYANRIKCDSNDIKNYIAQIPCSTTSIFTHPTNKHEIGKLIDLLPSKTSSGFDDISNNLLKELKHSISLPLELIFNKSLVEGVFPERMKLADVIPLHKSKDPLESTNYRPISLLLTISKLLEKVVYKRTYDFLEQTKQLYQSQYWLSYCTLLRTCH